MTSRRRRAARAVLPAALVALAVAGCVELDAAGANDVEHDHGEDLVLATYPVTDGVELGEAVLAELDDDGLVRLRDDQAAHEDAWRLWLAVAPEPWQSAVERLRMVTDGPEDDLAGVVRIDGDRWILELDAADLADRDQLEHTLVHELAHLISLAPDQVSRQHPPFDLLLDAQAACRPAVGVEEGCLAPSSYLGRFIERFWDDAQLEAADEISWSDDPEALVTDRYEAAPGHFVTDYAATHPEEDFAESWTAYVLFEWETEDPAEPWVAKVAFFDDFPELRAARAEIWSALDLP